MLSSGGELSGSDDRAGEESNASGAQDSELIFNRGSLRGGGKSPESNGTRNGNGYCQVTALDVEEQSGRGLLVSLSQAGLAPNPAGGWASAQPLHSNPIIADEIGKANLFCWSRAGIARSRANIVKASSQKKARGRQEAKALAEAREVEAEGVLPEAEVQALHSPGTIAPRAKKKKGPRARHR